MKNKKSSKKQRILSLKLLQILRFDNLSMQKLLELKTMDYLFNFQKENKDYVMYLILDKNILMD